MSLELAKAWVTVRGDSSQLTGDLNKAKVQVDGAMGSIVNKAKLIGAAIAAAGVGFLVMGVKAAAAREQIELSFEVMLGSAEKAQSAIADLTKYAAETPFEMPEILQTARGLIQFGETGKEMMSTLEMLGNAAAGTNTPFAMLGLIFNQVRGVGKLVTQDFRQMSTRGVISLQDIAKYYGVTAQAAAKMLSEGKVSFEDFRQILANLSKEGGRYYQMTARQSKTLSGMFSTLKDSVNLLAAELAGPLVIGLKKISELVIYLMDNYSGLLKMFLRTAVVIGSIIGVIYLFAKAQKVAAAATIFLKAMTGPAGWAQIGIGLAVATAGVIAMNIAMNETIESSKVLAAETAQVAKADEALIKAQEAKVAAANALQSSIEKGRSSMQDMWYEYRTLNGEMTDAQVGLDKFIKGLDKNLKPEQVKYLAEEFAYVQEKIAGLQLKKELEDSVISAKEQFAKMGDEIFLMNGGMTEAEKKAKDFAATLDERLGADQKEKLVSEFKQLQAEMDRLEGEKKMKERGKQITESMRTPADELKTYLAEIVKLRRGGFISQGTAAGALLQEKEKFKLEPLAKAGTTGFTDLGRGLQDALLRRDDPQKKMAAELIKQTAALLGIKENTGKPQKSVAVLGA
jgi:tape measure domain-containing protein